MEASVRTSIAELRDGTEVEGVFACTRKERLTARNGSGYLSVELRDRTGAIWFGTGHGLTRLVPQNGR